MDDADTPEAAKAMPPHRADAMSNFEDVVSSRIAETMLSMIAARAASATVCPSEIARALAPGDEAAWRALMPQVRLVAGQLAAQRRVSVTRGGVTVDATAPGGPIRLGRP